jgi:hypothetical protein
MDTMRRALQSWGAQMRAVVWLQRLLGLRRRAAEVWAMTPDGKLIRL